MSASLVYTGYLVEERLQHIPCENSVFSDSSMGKRRFNFMVWPSVGVRVNPDMYMQAVDFCRDASGIFFDGNYIIIPRRDTSLISRVSEKYQATEIVFSIPGDERYSEVLGDEFATRAIQLGVIPRLVVLGNSVMGIAGSVDEMLKKSIDDPAACESEWEELYERSMSEQ